jgi:NAD(P)-dependent dehydrogenase (short-subunit alcohol dehydrogenase family)
MRDFAGKAAFVTGGASGIGLALGRAFLEAGMRVMLADIEPAALDQALAGLKAYDNRVRGVIVDVADRAAMQRAAGEAIDAFGRIHVLCNNAGVGGGGPQGQIPAADWDWTIDINLNGVFNGISEFLPHIRAHGEGGHIVNTASMAGMISVAMMAPYCASKYAVVALSEGLAAELDGSNTGVSVLCPGWVRTRINDSGRNRPSRYGAGTAPPPAAAARAALVAEALKAGMDPAVVAARVLAAIRDGDLYIFTHPEMRGPVEERFRRILAAFDKAPALNAAAQAKA